MSKIIECTLDNLFHEVERKGKDGVLYPACTVAQFIEVEPRSGNEFRKELHTWKLPDSWSRVLSAKFRDYYGKKVYIPILESVWEGKINRRINPDAEIPFK